MFGCNFIYLRSGNGNAYKLIKIGLSSCSKDISAGHGGRLQRFHRIIIILSIEFLIHKMQTQSILHFGISTVFQAQPITNDEFIFELEPRTNLLRQNYRQQRNMVRKSLFIII